LGYNISSCSSGPVADLKAALRQSNGSNIILSSEVFDTLGDIGLSQLVNILQDYQTTVVIFHRRKVGHLLSYYAQNSKHRLRPTTFWVF
jgi:hypothetical protein